MTAPPSPARPSTSRLAVTAAALSLAGAAGLVVAALLALWVADQLGSTRLWRVESVVAAAVVTLGVLACGWVAVSSLVAAACAGARAAGGAWRGGEAVVHRWAPGLVRRALAVALAAGVGLGTAAGAHAAPTVPVDLARAVVTADLGWAPTADRLPASADATTAVPGSSPEAPPAASPAPGGAIPEAPAATPSPAPATSTAPTADASPATAAAGGPLAPVAAPVPASVAPPALAHPAPPGAPPAGRTVEVQPGDTLWAVAARSLGPGASDAAIAAEWPRWYAANASVIGPDPDLLHPGQVLTAPTAPDGSTR
ncbi:LysM peptidoglycan-binding domain-containing protein [Cellulomonas wangsupingiae]|uniref:LysM peptidoglycan-binding domain-containing protein n=1 Tax=Cellulomonas wangsupingiae TaxID=2968085 RepID=UPI001D0EDB17|nr:LysM domain-containing protein [Cellulomonas wangsupingiae]MCM0640272.1 LysM peptidoglycan-binding domain-containing protein [Cellulomonas wangsupingiae]